MTATAGDVRQWCIRKPCYVPNPCCGRILCLHEDYCEVYEMEHERLESIDAFNRAKERKVKSELLSQG